MRLSLKKGLSGEGEREDLKVEVIFQPWNPVRNCRVVGTSRVKSGRWESYVSFA